MKAATFLMALILFAGDLAGADIEHSSMCKTVGVKMGDSMVHLTSNVIITDQLEFDALVSHESQSMTLDGKFRLPSKEKSFRFLEGTPVVGGGGQICARVVYYETNDKHLFVWLLIINKDPKLEEEAANKLTPEKAEANMPYFREAGAFSLLLYGQEYP